MSDNNDNVTNLSDVRKAAGMHEAATIGDNFSKLPLAEQLALKHGAIFERAKELFAACGRSPEEIDDDATQGKIGDLFKLLDACLKRAETARVEEKEPFLHNGRIVDDFFKENAITMLERWKAVLRKRSDLYLNKKRLAAEAKAREDLRKAQEEAAKRQELARKAEEESRRQSTKDKANTAAAVAAIAVEQAQQAVETAPAEAVQTRGEHSLATQSMMWTHEVENWEAVDPREFFDFISRDDLQKAIRAFVRIHKGTKPLAGVRIFEAPKTNFR